MRATSVPRRWRGAGEAACCLPPRYCIDISNQLMAIESLVAKTNATVLKAHIAGCVRSACHCGTDAERDEKLLEVEDVIDKLSR